MDSEQKVINPLLRIDSSDRKKIIYYALCKNKKAFLKVRTPVLDGYRDARAASANRLLIEYDKLIEYPEIYNTILKVWFSENKKLRDKITEELTKLDYKPAIPNFILPYGYKSLKKKDVQIENETSYFAPNGKLIENIDKVEATLMSFLLGWYVGQVDTTFKEEKKDFEIDTKNPFELKLNTIKTELEEYKSLINKYISEAQLVIKDLSKKIITDSKLSTTTNQMRTKYQSIKKELVDLAKELHIEFDHFDTKVKLLNDLNIAVEIITRHLEFQDSFKEKIFNYKELLNKILQLEHKKNKSFQPLVNCQDAAKNILKSIENLTKSNEIIDIKAVEEELKPFECLINLINEINKEITLSDNQVDEYLSIVEDKFGSFGNALYRQKCINFESQKESVTATVIETDSTTKKIKEADSTISPSQINEKNIIDFESEYDNVPWKEEGIPPIELFKGRDELINILFNHYRSLNRTKTYILYGLTRSGKSSIIDYLARAFEGQEVKIRGVIHQVLPIIWNFGEAESHTKAEDMWYYLIEKCTLNKIDKLTSIEKLKLDKFIRPTGLKYRFITFKKLIDDLKLDNIYPLIMIDEFTYFKNLHKRDILGPSFLSVIREMSFKQLCGFLFAGTYDLSELITSPAYGITGQLTNTIDFKVNQISEKASIELINAWSDKLSFSNDAIKQILFLSNCIPYFIQIICKCCGFYAIENDKWFLNYEDVEGVTRILIGDEKPPQNSMLNPLPTGTFQGNQYGPQDSRSVNAVISSICYYNRSRVKPVGVNISQIFDLWGENGIPKPNVYVSEAIEILKNKGVVRENGNEENEYFLSVDLFRRWWDKTHPDIKLELNFVPE